MVMMSKYMNQMGRPASNLSLAFAAGLAVAGALWVNIANAADAEVDTSKLPAASEKKVDFAKDIQPILKKACQDCHDAGGGAGDFSVDSEKSILKGGEHGKMVIPGKSAKSPMIHYVGHLVKGKDMPPEGAGDPLTKEQIALLRAWIDQLPKDDKAPKDPAK